jgi:hypothetical protein
MTAASNVKRITALEISVNKLTQDQPIRDYLIAALARQHGIAVPGYFGERP